MRIPAAHVATRAGWSGGDRNLKYTEKHKGPTQVAHERHGHVSIYSSVGLREWKEMESLLKTS